MNKKDYLPEKNLNKFNQKKVNIIVPFHIPKIVFLHKLLKSFELNKPYVDLYLVFTNQKEYYFTKKKLNLKGVKIIILPSNINKSLLNKKNIYPSFKKFYALDKVIKNNQYSICIDSESILLNLRDIFNVCKNFCNKKEVYGDICYNTISINRDSFNFLKYFMPKEIEKEIDLGIYFWFSEIPIYDNKITRKFLDIIQFNNYNNIIEKLSWNAFEYNIYMYYCCLKENYKIINLNLNLNWSLECNKDEHIFDKLEERNIILNWRFWKYPKLNRRIKILYHLDR